MKQLVSLGFLFLLASFYIQAQPEIELMLLNNTFNQPVDITHAGDERLFIVEKAGMIKIMSKSGVVHETPFIDLRDKVNARGSERGLLGLAFHPDFAQNGYFYVNYTFGSGGDTRVARYSVDATNPDLGNLESELVILEVGQPEGNHNAGDLAFGPDGMLYIAFGDGGGAGDRDNYSQTRSSLLGKMLRIDVDNGTPYSIPDDNPFIGDNSTPDEIWAIGLRNPWRYCFDRATGELWIADVGQNAAEEINVQPAGSTGGENYGWRCFEGNETFRSDADCVTSSESTFPVYAYGHRGAFCGGSVTGGFVYRGSDFPELDGLYFFAEYCTGDVFTIERQNGGNSTEVTKVLTGPEQVWSTFGEDNDGELYIASLSGEVSLITQANTTSIDTAREFLKVAVAQNPFHESLQLNIEATVNGFADIQVINGAGQKLYGQSHQFAEQTTIFIELPSIAPGVYYVSVNFADHRIIRKVIKQ